jgi:HEAT repeats
MQERIIDYIENNLSGEALREFEQNLAADPALQQQVAELQETLRLLQKMTPLEPPEAMDETFYAWLQHETPPAAQVTTGATQPILGKIMAATWLRVAAAAVVLLGVFWIGRRTADTDLSGLKDQVKELASLRHEVQETKQLMMTMLREESASKRIKAVNYSYTIEKPDNEVMKVLINTLNHDENINVRLAAVDALSHFGKEKIVRDALIHSLVSQREPDLQIAIIDMLVMMNEKRAVPQMQQLLVNEQTEPLVKRRAQESVRMLDL